MMADYVENLRTENLALKQRLSEVEAERDSLIAERDMVRQQCDYFIGLHLIEANERAALVADQERMREALDAAWLDIKEWQRFARELREKVPNPNFSPLTPTEAGIAKSERVVQQIGAALSTPRQPEGAPMIEPNDLYRRMAQEGQELHDKIDRLEAEINRWRILANDTSPKLLQAKAELDARLARCTALEQERDKEQNKADVRGNMLRYVAFVTTNDASGDAQLGVDQLKARCQHLEQEHHALRAAQQADQERMREALDAVIAFQLHGGGPLDADDVQLARRRQRDGSSLWSVTNRGYCLNKGGEWEYEPIPSSRDDAFMGRCRFASEDEARSAFAALSTPRQPKESLPHE